MYSSGFRFNIRLRANVSHGFIAENGQNLGSLKTCRLFRDFLSGCTDNKIKPGFVTPIGLLVEAVQSFRVRSVMNRWSGQGTL